MAKRIANPPMIEIEAEDINGNVCLLKARHMQPSELNEMGKIIETITMENAGDKLKEQAAYVFGGKVEDYEKFNLRVLRSIIDCWRDENLRPLTPQA